MTEQNRKTLRSFYCRDYLWELFEVMTRDLGCSMDYLINEAMRHYARSRNYSLSSVHAGPAAAAPPPPAPTPSPAAYSAPEAPPPTPSSSPLGGAPRSAVDRPSPGDSFHPRGGGGRGGFEHRTFERMPAAQRGRFGQMRTGRMSPAPSRPPGGIAPSPPAPPAAAVARPPAPPGPPPPPVPKGPPGPPPPPPPPAATAPPSPPPPAPPAPSAVPAPPSPPPAAAAPGRPSLSLIYNGQRYPVSKDKFIIGRASNMTDLTIRDGNISRKHCAIIYRGGNYYIKDLDSTNGIEYKGNRIDSKKVEEGDQFNLCDYELRFTFR